MRCPAAHAARVGIIARVPLASGLLSGRYTHETSFAADDHRTFNRHGEAFDAGETFSGVDFDTGVDAAREFAALAPAGATPAQAALRWVIQQPGVSTVIPGARNPEQAEQNAAAAALPPFSDAALAAIADLYDRRIRARSTTAGRRGRGEARRRRVLAEQADSGAPGAAPGSRAQDPTGTIRAATPAGPGPGSPDSAAATAAWSSALRFWLSLCLASTVSMASSTPTIPRSWPLM